METFMTSIANHPWVSLFLAIVGLAALGIILEIMVDIVRAIKGK